MDKWLRDLIIYSALMILGGIGGYFALQSILINHYSFTENQSQMYGGLGAVALVYLVIIIYIIFNHMEDFAATFGGKKRRDAWIAKDKRITKELLEKENKKHGLIPGEEIQGEGRAGPLGGIGAILNVIKEDAAERKQDEVEQIEMMRKFEEFKYKEKMGKFLEEEEILKEMNRVKEKIN